MYICICNGVSDKQIQKAIQEDGACSVDMVTEYTSAGNCCGSCLEDIEKMVEHHTQPINDLPPITLDIPMISSSSIKSKIIKERENMKEQNIQWKQKILNAG